MQASAQRSARARSARPLPRRTAVAGVRRRPSAARRSISTPRHARVACLPIARQQVGGSYAFLWHSFSRLGPKTTVLGESTKRRFLVVLVLIGLKKEFSFLS